jgi:hypothetical protein
MSERAGTASPHISRDDRITGSIKRQQVDSAPNDPAATTQPLRGRASVSGEAFASDDMIGPERSAVECLSEAKADLRPLTNTLAGVASHATVARRGGHPPAKRLPVESRVCPCGPDPWKRT